MRELKFRIWDKEDMDYLGLVSVIFGNENELLDNQIVMQYTGVKDRKGKEIYEGDLVRISPLLSTKLRNPIYEVVYTDGCFEIHNGKFRDYLKCAFVDFSVEVVGNKFENKELLTS